MSTVQSPVPSSDVFAEIFAAGTDKVGSVTSCTTTVTVCVEVLFEASVAVMVTVLLPVFVQLKVEGEIDAFGLLSQISLTDAITSDKEIEAFPFASRSTGAMFETATIVGAVASTTFTVAVSVVTLPEASVAVTVTVGVVPASEQVNELGEIVTEETLQLSAVASTTCEG